MIKGKTIVLVLGFAVLLMTLTGVAFAQEGSKNGGNGAEEAQWVQPGLNLDTSLSAAINYLGLKLTNTLSYKIPLIKNNGMLWKSTKIEFGISDDLTPSYHRISAMLQIEPIAFFDVKVLAGYDLQWFFLTGGVFDTPDPSTIAAGSWGTGYGDVYDETTGQTGHGFRLKVMPTAKIAVGPIAAMYTFTLGYHTYNVDTPTGFYYDAETATIQRITDTYMVHDVKLVARFLDFMVGANFIYTDLVSWDYRNIKLAGLLVYTPSWSFLPDNLSPYGIIQAGSFLEDRYHTGHFSAAMVLGIVIGLR